MAGGPPARRASRPGRPGRPADSDLLAVRAVEDLSDRDLLALLQRSTQALTALHGHEVLMGWLMPTSAAARSSAPTAASVGLRALAAGRAAGLADEEIVARQPSVLALVAPRVGATATLPSTVAATTPTIDGEPDQAALLREALRLRARWLQELTARAAWELGRRLHRQGLLDADVDVRRLRLADLADAVQTGSVPAGIVGVVDRTTGAPLPARFRLTVDGAIQPAATRRHRRHRAGTAGTGAGGGRGSGVVHGGDGPPEPGAVLVVRTLDPNLAALLPRLGGLVAETGSVLSHLAILAREFGVPTVVGVDEAVNRFPGGTTLVVDGTTGEVSTVGEHRKGAA